MAIIAPTLHPLEPLLEAAQKLLDVDVANALELALEIGRKASDMAWQPGQARSLLIVGLAEQRRSNLVAATEACLAALDHFSQLNDPRGCLECLTSLGRIYRDRGELQPAEEVLQRALGIAQKSSNQEAQAEILNLQASVLGTVGNFSRALQLLNQALEIARRAKMQRREVNILNNLGIMLTELGDYPRALEHLTTAYQLSTEQEFGARSEMIILGSIGNLYYNTGEYIRSIQHFQQALDISRREDNSLAEASILNNLGNVQLDLGNLGKSQELFEQALELSQRLGFRALEVDNLDGLGKVLTRSNRFVEAKQTLHKALQIAQEVQSQDSETDALYNLGHVFLKAGEPQVSLSYLHQALELSQHIRRNKSTYETHHLLAEAYEQLGNLAQALHHQREYHRVERELFNEQSQRKAQVLSIQFEMEQTRRESDLLRIRFDTAQQAQAQAEAKVRERTKELEQAQLEIVMRLAIAAEYRDDKTGEHTWRVGRNAALIAQQLNLPESEVSAIRSAARLHDVGKIGIPDAILLKPDRLTLEEFGEMKTHTLIGARILSGGHSSLLRLAEQIALSHHERWDGKGYPYGLTGDDIPLAGRIVAVADVFDALTHERPYKRAWSVNEALAEIERQSGSQFDPQIVQACLKVFNNFDTSYEQEVLLDDLDTNLMVNVRLEQTQLQMAERDIAGLKEHFETLMVERTRELESARRHAITLARRMELMAHTDVLTGLGNRRAFETDLETELTQAMRTNQPLSVLTLDLDNLKLVNDSEGHERGDEMLREFGSTIASALRPWGRVYRVGGDEFAALLPKVSGQIEDEILEQIERSIQILRDLGFERFNVSAGLASYPDEAASEGDLVRLSDQRMYQQKLKHRIG